MMGYCNQKCLVKTVYKDNFPVLCFSSIYQSHCYSIITKRRKDCTLEPASLFISMFIIHEHPGRHHPWNLVDQNLIHFKSAVVFDVLFYLLLYYWHVSNFSGNFAELLQKKLSKKMSYSYCNISTNFIKIS